VTGRQFFQLHEKFEEIYDDINEKADEIAERLLHAGRDPCKQLQ
jgi:starvation-inducible DNA-binding protein